MMCETCRHWVYVSPEVGNCKMIMTEFVVKHFDTVRVSAFYHCGAWEEIEPAREGRDRADSEERE